MICAKSTAKEMEGGQQDEARRHVDAEGVAYSEGSQTVKKKLNEDITQTIIIYVRGEALTPT